MGSQTVGDIRELPGRTSCYGQLQVGQPSYWERTFPIGLFDSAIAVLGLPKGLPVIGTRPLPSRQLQNWQIAATQSQSVPS